ISTKVSGLLRRQADHSPMLVRHGQNASATGERIGSTLDVRHLGSMRERRTAAGRGMRLASVTFAAAVLGSVLVACSHNPASTGPTPVTPTLPTSGRPTTGGGGHNLYHGVKLPASAFKRNTWGFIGCSNTHDTIWGYHNAPGTTDLFWPYVPQYRIEGQVILDWADPNSQDWHLFDLMKQRYNHGSDPAVVWVQLCENLSLTQRSTYGIATVSNVRAELTNLKAHAPTSVVFVSPLQSYSPPTLCALMGAGGEGVDDLKKLADAAVKQ